MGHPAGEGLASGGLASDREEFRQAVEFLFTVRCFLHYRHERDDNTLDWQAQDAAAAAAIGLGQRRLQWAEPGAMEEGVEAAYWMRHYFRNARSVERGLAQMLDGAAGKPGPRTVEGLGQGCVFQGAARGGGCCGGAHAAPPRAFSRYFPLPGGRGHRQV